MLDFSFFFSISLSHSLSLSLLNKNCHHLTLHGPLSEAQIAFTARSTEPQVAFAEPWEPGRTTAPEADVFHVAFRIEFPLAGSPLLGGVEILGQDVLRAVLTATPKPQEPAVFDAASGSATEGSGRVWVESRRWW